MFLWILSVMWESLIAGLHFAITLTCQDTRPKDMTDSYLGFICIWCVCCFNSVFSEQLARSLWRNVMGNVNWGCHMSLTSIERKSGCGVHKGQSLIRPQHPTLYLLKMCKTFQQTKNPRTTRFFFTGVNLLLMDGKYLRKSRQQPIY